MAIPAIFDQAYNFSEGLASVQLGHKWGYIDRTAKVITKPQFPSAARISGLTCPQL